MNQPKQQAPGKAEADPDAVLPAVPRPSRWPVVFALLAILGVLAMAGAGQYYWQSLQDRFAHLREVIDHAGTQQKVLSRRVEDTALEFAAQERRLREQEDVIRRQTETLAAREQSLKSQEEALRRSLENLQQSVGRTAHGWRAAEAAYLVELAQRRLSLEADVPTALKALAGADQRLQETGDPRWQPMRERIQAQVRTLQGLETADRAKLAKTLVNMAAGVEHLPLRPRRPSPSRKPEPKAQSASPERGLAAVLEDGLTGFRSLVQVRRDDRSGPPVAGQDQRYALYQNLRLQLDSARFGLLRGDPELYTSSLDTAELWLQTFFRTEAPETRLYLDDITALRSARVRPELPDLGALLQALRAELDTAEAAP